MTNSYMITCCPTVDLPMSYLAERGIPYPCSRFRMNGMKYNDNLGRPISIENFYENTGQGAIPTTSQVNPEQYEAMSEPILKEGKNIIHMILSSSISGTCNPAVIARDKIPGHHPDRRIAVIDSCCVPAGCGLLVDTAWEKMQVDVDYKELVLWIEEDKKRIHHWFFTSNLTYLRRGGRISTSAAFFGNILNICPLMNVNMGDKLIPRDKYRSKRRVIRRVVERMKEHVQQDAVYNGKCSLSQSSCPEDAGTVAGLAGETFPQLNGKVFIVDIDIVIGPHTGPGAVCLVFWGDKRTVQLASRNHSLIRSH